jgi:hypothetical protein
MLKLIRLTLLVLPLGASETLLRATPQVLSPPVVPACTGGTCAARVDVFPTAPELHVRPSHVKDGQAATPYNCDPCIDCSASVTVRINPLSSNVTATVWEWGRVPSPDEEEAQGGIPYSDLSTPGASMRRTLIGECGGLIPVGPGSSILTVDLTTPAGRSIVTIWLACFC